MHRESHRRADEAARPAGSGEAARGVLSWAPTGSCRLSWVAATGELAETDLAGSGVTTWPAELVGVVLTPSRAAAPGRQDGQRSSLPVTLLFEPSL